MCQTNRQTHKVKLAVSGPFRSQKSLSISKKALTLIQGFMKRVLLCTMRVRCLLSEHFHEFEWENGCGRLHRYTGALHCSTLWGLYWDICAVCALFAKQLIFTRDEQSKHKVEGGGAGELFGHQQSERGIDLR